MVKITKDNQNQEKNKLEDLETIPTDESTPDYGEIWAEWQFQEFIKHERGRIWYILFSITIAALLISSYFFKNPLFAIILVLGLIVYIIGEKRGPNTVHIAMTEDGLVLNNKLIRYEDVDSFYIIYYPPEIKNLYIQSRIGFRQLTTIHLEDMNPVEIRQILLNYIKEDLAKEEMPLSDGLAHRLKL